MNSASAPPPFNQELAQLASTMSWYRLQEEAQQEEAQQEEAQKEGLSKMNPIAREKFAPVFKLLEIRVRYVNNIRSGDSHWVIQKATRSGLQYRQEWSAPAHDPGCSLAAWDAMVGELLDNIKKADNGNATDNNRTAVAGHQADSRAGTP